MAIRIDTPNLLAVFRSVEGQMYAKDETEIREMNGIPIAEAYAKYIAYVDRVCDSPADAEERAKRLSSQGSTQIIIYGCGGWDRYFVRGDGSIVFSRRHGTDRTIQLALKAGFDISG